MEGKLLTNSKFLDKRVIIRTVILFILSLIFIGIVPSRVDTIKNYISLTSKSNTLKQETEVIMSSLPSADEVYKAFNDVGFQISVCGVSDYKDGEVILNSYSGEVLEPYESRTLEFIVSYDDKFNYRLVSLSAYNLAFKKIYTDVESSSVSIEVYVK